MLLGGLINFVHDKLISYTPSALKIYRIFIEYTSWNFAADFGCQCRRHNKWYGEPFKSLLSLKTTSSNYSNSIELNLYTYFKAEVHVTRKFVTKGFTKFYKNNMMARGNQERVKQKNLRDELKTKCWIIVKGLNQTCEAGKFDCLEFYNNIMIKRIPGRGKT